MKIKIESPYDNGEYEGVLAMFKHFKKQLEYYQKQNDTECIRRDIEGYNLILSSGKESNASNFLEIKTNSKLGKIKPFKDNIEIIEYMKLNNFWE